MEEELGRLAKAVGVELEGSAVTALLRHLELVMASPTNVTGISDPHEALVRHIVDSLAIVPLVAECPPGRVADIGAGAGYPGIPVAVAASRDVILVESNGKKADFLRRAVPTDARIEVFGGRAEALAVEQPESFAVVTARAVAALPVLVELAAPLLVQGGRLIAMKGRPEAVEFARGVEAAGILGMREIGRRRLHIPRLGGERVAVIYERVGRPQVPVPRRPGMARKRPLA